MKKTVSLLLLLALALCLAPMAQASGEPGLSPDEQAWWDAYQCPEGMADTALYPDEALALRQKNYETVCRFMQGLSPYLYLLYAEDFTTGVAYDFSRTADAMRNSDLSFQKQLDAGNAESYPDWRWSNIRVYQSENPNVFVVECDGSGTLTEDGVAVRTHADHYLHRFTLSDGLITEYIEFNNPIQELLEMGVDVPGPGGMPSGGASGEASGEASSGEPSAEASGEPSAEAEEAPSGEASSAEPAALSPDEQAWWDAYRCPEGMAETALYPDEALALRQKNYETVCRFMQNLSPYLYLLYADAFSTGVAYDFGGTTNPFNPVMCTNLTMQKALDASNAQLYPDWAWTDCVVYQSEDPNVFLVECDGAGSGHSDHYVHKFVLDDGKIAQYVEFNSPLNELIEGGYELPALR